MRQHATTVGVDTYERIKRDIIFGRLEPGSKLKLGGLKSRYAASASTLRESLCRLTSDGFVAAEQQRGFFVTPVSKADLVEVANLRILLECHALQASIENGDTEWEGDLVAAHHKLRRVEERMLSGDDAQKETWKCYDWQFHQAMIQACNSNNLVALHAILYDKYLRYQMLVLTYRGEQGASEHEAMFKAALSRDPIAAQKLLKEHIRNGLDHTLPALPD